MTYTTLLTERTGAVLNDVNLESSKYGDYYYGYAYRYYGDGEKKSA